MLGLVSEKAQSDQPGRTFPGRAGCAGRSALSGKTVESEDERKPLEEEIGETETVCSRCKRRGGERPNSTLSYADKPQRAPESGLRYRLEQGRNSLGMWLTY